MIPSSESLQACLLLKPMFPNLKSSTMSTLEPFNSWKSWIYSSMLELGVRCTRTKWNILFYGYLSATVCSWTCLVHNPSPDYRWFVYFLTKMVFSPPRNSSFPCYPRSTNSSSTARSRRSSLGDQISVTAMKNPWWSTANATSYGYLLRTPSAFAQPTHPWTLCYTVAAHFGLVMCAAAKSLGKPRTPIYLRWFCTWNSALDVIP